MIILVRNIDRAITEEEMYKLLAKHGKVRTFDLVMDKATGESKGFGFADMPSQEEAAEAIKALDGFKLGTLALRVKRAAASSLLKEAPPRARKSTGPRKNGGRPRDR